ncbi:MAG TPA: hypothetical protein VGL44_10065 [Gaiellales bacterium]|jgi:hypothetical protein
MDVHAVRRGELQRAEMTDASRFTVSTAARFARKLCACPVCGRSEPRIYRSSLRSVTLQCGHCRMQWTQTWYMLARAVEREVAPRLEVDAAAVTTAVLNLLGELEHRGGAEAPVQHR